MGNTHGVSNDNPPIVMASHTNVHVEREDEGLGFPPSADSRDAILGGCASDPCRGAFKIAAAASGVEDGFRLAFLSASVVDGFGTGPVVTGGASAFKFSNANICTSDFSFIVFGGRQEISVHA